MEGVGFEAEEVSLQGLRVVPLHPVEAEATAQAVRVVGHC